MDPTISTKMNCTKTSSSTSTTIIQGKTQKFLNLEVIKPVMHATPWISGFVIIELNKDTSTKAMMKDPHPKSKIQVCVDPSNLNKVTAWEPYYYWTIEDVIPELHAAKYFTIVDMECGF